MTKAFPLSYSTRSRQELLSLVHIESAKGVPLKKSDYFSVTAEKIFSKYVFDKEQGYYGLPTPMEVA